MSFKKLFIYALTTALSMGMLTACGGPRKKAVKDPLVWIADPSSFEEYMNNAKIKSLTDLGNTYRLKKAIDKARNGEDVNIVYIGGSITEGDGLETCYANRSYNYFKDTFGKGKGENVHYFNSGISGTPSSLGALRFENDVLKHQPDIVFIEFAVNDGGDDDIDKAAFEAMIRDAINYETKPAIILLFARMQEGWTSQDWKKEIGAHYGVSMISYADGITYLFDEGAMQWSEFSGDYTHPHAEGNAVVADFISYFYDEVDRQEASAEDLTMPDAMFPEYYTDAHMLLSSDTEPTSVGTWKKGSSGFHYSDGWTKKYTEENEPLVFEFTGRSAYVIYPTKGEAFEKLVAKVYFNGELVDTKQFDEHLDGGWSCPYVGVLHREYSAGDYRIEFTAPEGKEKCDLQVLAVAYTE